MSTSTRTDYTTNPKNKTELALWVIHSNRDNNWLDWLFASEEFYS